MNEEIEPQSELPELPALHPTTKKIIEDFIGDIRRLCIIYGSQDKVAARLGVGLRTIQRWFAGWGMPSMVHYLTVKRVIADELELAKKEAPCGKITKKR